MEINSNSLQENQNPSANSSAAGNSPNRRTPPPQPIPITRSDPNNPYPTTFVQADTSSFKQVVQMLTGSTETTARPEPSRSPIPPLKTGLRKDHKSGNSKLYERRHSFKNFKISPLASGPVNGRPGLYSGLAGSPRHAAPEILSPSILDFPSLALSPVTPLTRDPFNRVGSAGNFNLAAEDKAIREKGFYLHPSPANTPRESEPRLLPLFPVTSPKFAGSSAANA
ncbi:VQ motif-containing protein [Striga asiatica]|uniref:VQ motif-containing protein n=1 Tax=Striga asiatica TaxID=4170 RepID=A0A5A7PUT4_STRAF|nr:VQ motif-containing protein [Striga asiatica]